MQRDTDEGQVPHREAWQVVGCTACKAPPGMRCTGQRMTTHAVRRRALMERLANEADLRQADGPGNNPPPPWAEETKPQASWPSTRPERADRPARSPRSGRSSRSTGSVQPGRGERGRGGRGDRGDRQGHGSPEAAATVRAPPRPGHQPHLQGGRTQPAAAKMADDSPHWEELAARLRVEQHMPALPPAVNTPTFEVSVASPELVTTTSAPGEAPHPLFTVNRKVENPQVWHLVPCPQCRMPAGTRCVGPLNQPRFASHSARLEAYRQFEASQPYHEPTIEPTDRS